jgi:hypothetical protein
MPDVFDTRDLQKLLQTFLCSKLREVFSEEMQQTPQDVFYHINPLCTYCENQTNCYKDAEAGNKVLYLSNLHSPLSIDHSPSLRRMYL